MRVTFWGVRGSCPVPGASTVRYGGNTPCTEIRCEDGTLIILDAGTGLRALGKSLAQEGFGSGQGVAHIFLSHTHHDHLYGLPYFDPIYIEGNRVVIYGPEIPGQSLREVVAGWMASTYHPAPLTSLRAAVEFRGINDGDTVQIGKVSVRAAMVNHTTLTNAYRIETEGTAVGYATDTGSFRGGVLLPDDVRAAVGDAPDDELLALMRARVVDLLQGCRLAIYDCMFDAREMAQRPTWGHSSAVQALEMCKAAGVGHLAMFHHNPDCSDAEIDARLAAARAMADGLQVSGAREGETLYVR